MPKVIKRGAMPQSDHVSDVPPPSRSRRGDARKGIKKRAEVDAEATAKKILHDAGDKADRIIREAKKQAEVLKQQGYDEGYQEGLGQYTEQTTRALMEVEKFKAAVEPEYLRLVVACVEKIIGEELKQNPEAILGIVRASLKAATQQREVNVRVNPADVETLRQKQRRLLDVLARANNIEIREDPSVARGGCIIVTELGTIDASLERQLAAIQAALDEEAMAGDAGSVDTGGGGGGDDYDDYDDYEGYD